MVVLAYIAVMQPVKGTINSKWADVQRVAVRRLIRGNCSLWMAAAEKEKTAMNIRMKNAVEL